MAQIDFSLLRQPDYVGGAIGAYQAGRQAAAQNALRGYTTDPKGTIDRLIAMGDISDAAGLANLEYQRSQRDLITNGAQALFGRKPPTATTTTPQPSPPPSAQATAQPQAQPPQAPAQASPQAAPQSGAAPTGQPSQQAPQTGQPPPQPPSPQQQQQLIGALDAVDKTAAGLASMPYEQRKAALAQAAPQLVAAGVPQQEIDGFDPTDGNIAQLHQQVQQVHAQLGTQPATPPAPSTATDANGQPIDLRNPDTVRALGMITMGNPQMGSALVNLGTATQPHFVAVRPGGGVMNDKTGQIEGAMPNAEGIQLVPDGKGGFTSQEVPNYREAHAANEAATAEAIAKAKMPYEVATAGGVQHARDAAHAPFEMVTVNMLDGTTQQMPLSDYQTLQKYGAGGSMGLGRSISPGNAEYQKLDAENFAKEVDAHGAGAIMPLQTARTNTEEAIKLAQAIQPNAWTGQTGHMANMLQAIPGLGKITAKQANDVSTYQALTQQVLRGSFTTFPRLEKEFEIVQKAAANVNTPKDAALILLGSQAAVADRNLAYANFVQNWTGPKSKQAMTQAFLQTPAGKTSIFADPIWQNLSIAGKPAVMVGNKPLADGHVYGVFRPNTPYAQTFVVQ